MTAPITQRSACAKCGAEVTQAVDRKAGWLTIAMNTKTYCAKCKGES